MNSLSIREIVSNPSIIFSGMRYLYFKKHSYHELFKRIIYGFLFTNYSFSNSNKIFFESLNAKKRYDLNLMHENFYISRSDSFLKSEVSICINYLWPFDFLIFCYLYIKSNDEFVVTPKRSIDKIAIFFSGLHFFSSARRFKNHCTEVCVFCDSVGIDSVIAAYYRAKGAYITCIQHGQYRFEPELINSDLIPFLNFAGDEIVVWGETTRREYERACIKDYKVVVGGRYFIPVGKNIGFNKFNCICAVLNGPDSQNLNSKLIEICKNFSKLYDVVIYVKKHPADKYDYDIKSYHDDLAATCLYVCHSSGFIIESLLLNRRFVVLLDKFLPTIYKRLPCLISNPVDIFRYYDNSSDSFWDELFKSIKMEYVINAQN